MLPEELFTIGKVYDSVDDVKSDISLYNNTHFMNFVISTNNKRSILIHCSHGRERKSESSGPMPKRRYNFLGCNASISLYKSQKANVSSVKVTQVNLPHNHTVSKEIHESQNSSLSEEEKQLLLMLKEANAKPSQSAQRIKNLINKFLKTNRNQDNQTLRDSLMKMNEDGADIDWVDDADGSVKVIFLSSKNMKNAFLLSEPPVVQMDTTFEVE